MRTKTGSNVYIA